MRFFVRRGSVPKAKAIQRVTLSFSRASSDTRLLCMLSRVLLALKVVVAVYWVWVAKALVFSAQSPFEVVVAVSAPLVLSFHFLQALLLLRRVEAKQPFWMQLGQTLLFGALYLVPLMLHQPRVRPQRSAR